MEKRKPPRIVLSIFRWYCSKDRLEELEGDLVEQFEIDIEENRTFPLLRFCWNVLMCARSYAFKTKKSYHSNTLISMLKSSYKSMYRSFKKNPLYGSLNILGLSLSFVVFGLLTIYVHYELSFEDFHDKADQIYRVSYRTELEDNITQWARVPVNYVNQLPEEVPGIESLIRFQNHERRYVKVGTRKFREDHIYQTDGGVFDVFTFTLIEGDPYSVLANPHSIVITEKLAKKYFGEEEALGKEISLMGERHSEVITYAVTGVMKDLPSNTHLPVDMLISFSSPEERTWWAYTYVLLQEGFTGDQLKPAIADLVSKYSQPGNHQESFVLQPLDEIHLTSHLAREIVPNGSLQNVKIFEVVGVLVLIIGLINFTNLNGVIFLAKFKEVGVRKVLGARRSSVVTYAILESVLFGMVSFGLGVLFIFILLPTFKSFSGAEVLIHPITLIVFLLLLTLFIGFLGGFYPSVLGSKYKPLSLLQKHISLPRSKNGFSSLKKMMLSIQFSIALLLIGCALVATDQFSFLKNKHVEVAPEQVLTLPRVPNHVKEDYQLLKEKLGQISTIHSISACMEVPSREIRDQGALVVDGLHTSSEDAPLVDIQVVDHQFFDLMNIQLVDGRFFPDYIKIENHPEFTADYTHRDYLLEKPRAYLINESAVKALGFEEPNQVLGMSAAFDQSWVRLANGPIVGVVKDYHQESLKNKIDPTVYIYEPLWFNTILMRVASQDMAASLEHVESVWNALFPNVKMDPHFLDDLYHRLYFKEKKQLELLYIFSVMSVVIAFLGIFAMVAYLLKTKTKEYAIRKVLGAKLSGLILATGKEYAIFLCIGFILAMPIGYYVMELWLNNFAYRVSISPANFLYALLILVTLLSATVIFQTIKSNDTNPANSLRDE